LFEIVDRLPATYYFRFLTTIWSVLFTGLCEEMMQMVDYARRTQKNERSCTDEYLSS